MELVTDTNCLISALIMPSKSRELICSFELSLYAPEEIISETLKHIEEILIKSKTIKEDLDLLVSILFSNIKLIPEKEFNNFKERALTLVKHPLFVLFLICIFLFN